MHWTRCLRTYVLANVFIVFMFENYVVNSEYIHEWAVEIEGGEEVAKELAEKHNYEYLGKIFPDVFHFRHRRLARRSANPSIHHQKKLTDESAVRWAEQQRVRRRVKRDLLPQYKSPTSRSDHEIRRDVGDENVHVILSDPKWPSMWYLNRGGGLDMNVERAWKVGATGKGIVVTILDDGLEKDHPDLIQNYDPNASYDVNSRDPDPEPRYDLLDSNRHGTRCAGEVAADANNSICAVGVAYEASVGGVRMLDGDVTDAVEARSLALNPQHIDIYSASWGPDDDGKTVDGPGQLATRAFIEGITRGRNGKGSIFVWASGNGGRDEDNCNCDGYTNAIWTLSISSATEKGRVPWYSEACSSTLATTYSSGALGERQIVTTDLHHSCTTTHTGTSASAPLAAGICALALHANKDLTWRDMQHIVVHTARPENLDTPDWQINGVGRKVSHRFGYGLMDAYGMVELAKNWTTVPPQRKCEVASNHMDKIIPQKSYVTLTLEVSECPGVNYLEHVQSKVSLMADRRGDIEVFLISPAGTKSNLLAIRPRDTSRTGFHSWPFMTVHMWGESPLGIWKLEIHNNGLFYSTSKASVQDWNLIFYGTEVEPGQPVDLNSLTGNAIEDTHSVHSLGGRTEERGRGSTSREQETRNLGEEVRSSGTSGGRSPTPTPVPLLGTWDKHQSQPIGCMSLSSIGDCIECDLGYFLHNNKCVHSCPQGYIVDEFSHHNCLTCHYSCRNCSGPYDYQCTLCWPDSTLSSPRKDETYCYATSLLESMNLQRIWLKFTLPIFSLLFLMILGLAFLTFKNGHSSIIRNRDHIKKGANNIVTYSAVNDNDAAKLMSDINFRDSSEDEL